MITAPLLSMFVVPAAYLLLRRGGLAKERRALRGGPSRALARDEGT